MHTLFVQARSLPKAAVLTIGVCIVWLTLWLVSGIDGAHLAAITLVVLAEVLLIAVLVGPWLSAASAVAAFLLLNWYIVPPTGTLRVDHPENLVTLVVFLIVAVAVAILMEMGSAARAQAVTAVSQVDLLGDVVSGVDETNPLAALETVRAGLGLDHVELRGELNGLPDQILVSTGNPSQVKSLDVSLADGFRLVGSGNEILAPDPAFLISIGNAAVRAYEGVRLIEETERANELAAIDRARIALLASVGHDLRTPLSTLRLSIETLRAGGASLNEQDRLQLQATIASSTDRLSVLIDNLLDMSRLQAGAVIAHMSETDVSEVVERVCLDYATSRLAVNIPPGLPWVAADPALLERICANLISNALRYSPDDSHIEVTAHVRGDRVVLDINDRGPGLEPGIDVFAPFHRIGTEADGGMGLGLAIVRGFAEAMDMSVDLIPRTDKGLTARVVMNAWGPSA